MDGAGFFGYPYPDTGIPGGAGLFYVPERYTGLSLSFSVSGSISRSVAQPPYANYTETSTYSASATKSFTRWDPVADGLFYSASGDNYDSFYVGTAEPVGMVSFRLDPSLSRYIPEFEYTQDYYDPRKPRIRFQGAIGTPTFVTAAMTVTTSGKYGGDAPYIQDGYIYMDAPHFGHPAGASDPRIENNKWMGYGYLSFGFVPASYPFIDVSGWSDAKWQDYRGTYNTGSAAWVIPAPYTGSVSQTFSWTLT